MFIQLSSVSLLTKSEYHSKLNFSGISSETNRISRSEERLYSPLAKILPIISVVLKYLSWIRFDHLFHPSDKLYTFLGYFV